MYLGLIVDDDQVYYLLDLAGQYSVKAVKELASVYSYESRQKIGLNALRLRLNKSTGRDWKFLGVDEADRISVYDIPETVKVLAHKVDTIENVDKDIDLQVDCFYEDIPDQEKSYTERYYTINEYGKYVPIYKYQNKYYMSEQEFYSQEKLLHNF